MIFPRWTAEPWEVDTKARPFLGETRIVRARSGAHIASFHGADDCERAISCVNAMAGIPSPSEYVRAVGGLEKHAKEVLDRWRAGTTKEYDLYNLDSALSALEAQRGEG